MIKQAVLSALAALGLLLAAASHAPAEARTGGLFIAIYKAGFVVGVSGGEGTLTLGGRRYPLRIGGVSLGATVGASRAELIGVAYNLRSPADIVGSYSAMEAGAAVVAGGKAVRLQNARGVILDLRGRQFGAMFSIDLSGMQVSLGR